MDPLLNILLAKYGNDPDLIKLLNRMKSMNGGVNYVQSTHHVGDNIRLAGGVKETGGNPSPFHQLMQETGVKPKEARSILKQRAQRRKQPPNPGYHSYADTADKRRAMRRADSPLPQTLHRGYRYDKSLPPPPHTLHRYDKSLPSPPPSRRHDPPTPRPRAYAKRSISELNTGHDAHEPKKKRVKRQTRDSFSSGTGSSTFGDDSTAFGRFGDDSSAFGDSTTAYEDSIGSYGSSYRDSTSGNIYDDDDDVDVDIDGSSYGDDTSHSTVSRLSRALYQSHTDEYSEYY